MRYSYQQVDLSRRYLGWVSVALLHLLLAWALLSGTAHKGLEILKKPLQAVVIQEVTIVPPPPPPPPPPPKEIKPPEPKAPKVEAPPPPPFVPPVEVQTPVAPAPVIVATPHPLPAPPVIAAPPPVAAPPNAVGPGPIAVPVPAPPAPAVAKAAARPEMALACPTQVAPEMPRKALQDGVHGVVRAQALIKDGVVKEVTILSGPRVFHAAVRSAMLQYKCAHDANEVLATQEFNFKIE